MKKATGYLKMQVLAAIDYEEGNSRRQRIKKVSERVFTDEYGQPHRFTWRTISTWYCRYEKHGLTKIQPKERADKRMQVVTVSRNSAYLFKYHKNPMRGI